MWDKLILMSESKEWLRVMDTFFLTYYIMEAVDTLSLYRPPTFYSTAYNTLNTIINLVCAAELTIVCQINILVGVGQL